jgi:hypothetical protein
VNWIKIFLASHVASGSRARKVSTFSTTAVNDANLDVSWKEGSDCVVHYTTTRPLNYIILDTSNFLQNLGFLCSKYKFSLNLV